MVDDATDRLVHSGSGGSVKRISSVSSKPTTDTSAGTARPRSAPHDIAAERHHVARRHDARDAQVEQTLCPGEPAIECEDRLDHPIVEVARRASTVCGIQEARQFALHRGVTGGADQQPDAFVTQLTQVAIRRHGRCVIVGRHARHRKRPGLVRHHRAVDRDQTDAASRDLVVDPVVGGVSA